MTPIRALIGSLEQIDVVEAAGNYVTVRLGATNHVVRSTMWRMEKRLAAGPFLRIHRSTIVNVNRISAFQPDVYGEYDVVLRDGTRHRLGGTYVSRARARLGVNRLSRFPGGPPCARSPVITSEVVCTVGHNWSGAGIPTTTPK